MQCWMSTMCHRKRRTLFNCLAPQCILMTSLTNRGFSFIFDWRISSGTLHGAVMVQCLTCWDASCKVVHWDFQNKGRSRWTGTSCFVLEVPLCNLHPSMCDFVLCDRNVLRAYSNQPSDVLKCRIFAVRES